MLEVNKMLLADAMISYVCDTGNYKIVMTDFADWCKDNYPEANEELEKLAANIFNTV